jgi:hypothetical protein
MSEQRYDLSYRGLLVPGADPVEVRRRLGAIFKLHEAGLGRLFTGKPVIVKRDVDAATAARYERLFAQAGAELTVVPLERSEPPPVLDPEPYVGVETRHGPGIDTSGLSLAPVGGVLEELPPPAPVQLDISHLSLVSGNDWTLEDCEPPPTPIPLPDLSYLTLEPLPRAERLEGGGRFF